jgi:hypothetical protein
MVVPANQTKRVKAALEGAAARLDDLATGGLEPPS